jgi:hypothetical protein
MQQLQYDDLPVELCFRLLQFFDCVSKIVPVLYILYHTYVEDI